MFYLIVCLIASTLASVLSDYPFRNPNLRWSVRVDDLVKRLTLDEVISQLAQGGGGKHGPASGVPRLDIKPFQWNTECLRGVALMGKATAFPQSINLGSMFSSELMKEVSLAIGSEVRAKANNYSGHGSYGDHQGLNCWSPMINLMRHPLWGRNQESYGEDPFLVSELAAAYVQGLQGSDDRYLQASVTCKHMMAYSGPEDKPMSRMIFDAKVSERDMRLSYLPAFKQCVESGTSGFMCSYNSMNGIPMCAHKGVLTSILREEWGFKGFVVSDMGAIENVVNTHRYVNTSLEAVRLTLQAGCNLELSTTEKPQFYSQIGVAVAKGLVMESEVRDLAKPLFYTRMRLGEFDPKYMNPYSTFNLSLVQSAYHQRLAIKTAMKSFILLKNEKLLPLTKKLKQIAIIGPMANNLRQLYGDYNAEIDRRYASTPLEGLRGLADTVKFAAGCSNNSCIDYQQNDIISAVKETDIIIVCLGTGVEIETEGRDRKDMNLPGYQKNILQDAITFSKAPVLLLLFSASPVNVTFAEVDSRIPAIMQCGFPAQATGQALYNTLTMATMDASPAARLPYTWYDTDDQIPSMVDYSMTGHTYRYFSGEPAYPFGYGLSYTTFTYFDLVYDPVVVEGQKSILVRVKVKNEGNIGSDEVTQVYISWLTTREEMPRQQLVAFDRKFIPPQEIVQYNFKISIKRIAIWSSTHGFVVESGDIGLSVGGQQPEQVKKVPSNVLRGKLIVKNTWKI